MTSSQDRALAFRFLSPSAVAYGYCRSHFRHDGSGRPESGVSRRPISPDLAWKDSKGGSTPRSRGGDLREEIGKQVNRQKQFRERWRDAAIHLKPSSEAENVKNRTIRNKTGDLAVLSELDIMTNLLHRNTLWRRFR